MFIFTKYPIKRELTQMLTFAKYPEIWENLRMKATKEKHRKLADYIESIQSNGKYWFTKKDVIKVLKITEKAFNNATHRLIKQTKIERIRNGFYVIIPPEFRNSKGLPPTYYIDALMSFHKQSYYIGVLSAASLHGASHQAAQELQVITTKPLKLIETKQARIRFITKKNFESSPVIKMKTPTGYINVSTKEATILDLLKYVRLAGHLDNVTTVISELMEDIKVEDLIKIAKGEKEFSHLQRLGFLIDKFSISTSASKELHKIIKSKNPNLVFLRPDKRKGVTEKNLKWNVLVNTPVEPDL